MNFNTKPVGRKVRLYSNSEILDKLRPDIVIDIVDFDMCDMTLYGKMEKYAHQLTDSCQ